MTSFSRLLLFLPLYVMLLRIYQQLKSGNWVSPRRNWGYLLIAFQMENLEETVRKILAIILNA